MLFVGSPNDFKGEIVFFVFTCDSEQTKSGFFEFLLIKFILFGSIGVDVIISFTTILPKIYKYDKWKNNQRKYQENPK